MEEELGSVGSLFLRNCHHHSNLQQQLPAQLSLSAQRQDPHQQKERFTKALENHKVPITVFSLIYCYIFERNLVSLRCPCI